MSRKPPLEVRDVRRGLAALGFVEQPTTATSHTKWVRYGTDKKAGKKFVVTVDAPKSPFTHDLVKSMAKQAGLSDRQFREACSKKGQKKARNGGLSWVEKVYGSGSPEPDAS